MDYSCISRYVITFLGIPVFIAVIHLSSSKHRTSFRFRPPVMKLFLLTFIFITVIHGRNLPLPPEYYNGYQRVRTQETSTSTPPISRDNLLQQILPSIQEGLQETWNSDTPNIVDQDSFKKLSIIRMH